MEQRSRHSYSSVQPFVPRIAPVERHLALVRGDGVIRGFVRNSSSGNASGALVCVQGWGGAGFGPHRLLWQLAQDASLAGFDAVRFDFLGRGDSDYVYPTTFPGAVADLQRVLSHLRKDQRVQEIHGVGLCFGAAVALYCWRQLDSIVLWSPDVIVEMPLIHRGIRAILAVPSLVRQVCRRSAFASVLRGDWSRWRAVVANEDTAPLSYKLPMPASWRGPTTANRRALILLGEDDPTRKASREVYERQLQRMGVRTDTITVPSADHDFCGTRQSQFVIRETLRWIGEAYDRDTESAGY